MGRLRDSGRTYDSGSKKRKAKETKAASQKELLSKTRKIDTLFRTKTVENANNVNETVEEPECSGESGAQIATSIQTSNFLANNSDYGDIELGDEGAESDEPLPEIETDPFSESPIAIALPSPLSSAPCVPPHLASPIYTPVSTLRDRTFCNYWLKRKHRMTGCGST